MISFFEATLHTERAKKTTVNDKEGFGYPGPLFVRCQELVFIFPDDNFSQS